MVDKSMIKRVQIYRRTCPRDTLLPELMSGEIRVRDSAKLKGVI